MSASRYVDHQILCDYPGCDWGMFGSEVGLQDGHTAQDVRKVLRGVGWMVNVPVDAVPGIGAPRHVRRLDFCRNHNPGKAVK